MPERHVNIENPVGGSDTIDVPGTRHGKGGLKNKGDLGDDEANVSLINTLPKWTLGTR
jgi:hypothetical protein